MKSYYYGISLDGLVLKIAEFEFSKNRLSLLRLESHKIQKSLITSFSMDYASDLNVGIDDLDISTNTDAVDIDKIDVLSDESPKSLNTLDDPPEKNPQKINTGADAAYQFLSKFSLNTGKLSLSCSEVKVQWKVIRSDKKLDINSLKKLALPREHAKDPSVNCDFIHGLDKSYNVAIHTGSYELISLLNNSAKVVYGSKKEPFYHYIEPYEVSMLNIFNLFYSKEVDKHTTFLYLGDEVRLGIIIKEGKLIKSFPIMIHDSDPQKVRETVFAKLMLEHEGSEYPVIENIVLAGSYATEDDITYYNARTRFKHQLFKLNTSELSKYKCNLRLSASARPELIPSFIIPISLGLKSYLSKHKDICKFNLVPKNITDARKPPKMNWFGMLLAVLIFFAIRQGKIMVADNISTLNRLKGEHERLLSRLHFLQNFESIMQGYQVEIRQMQELYQRSATISAGKNTWSTIIQMLSDFMNRNPLIWVDNISTQDTNFTIRGKSYHRDRITNLSRVFSDGHITRITETEIAGHTVWEFEISFLRPPGEETTAMVYPEHLQSYESFRNHFRAAQRSLLAISQNNVVNGVQDETSPPPLITAAEESRGLYELARNNYLSNNFTESISLLEQYIRQYSTGAEIALANYLLGEIYFVVNNFERAIPYFLEVIRLQRDQLPESMFFASRSYEVLGDYENAIRHYTMLNTRFPNHPLSATAREQLRLLREGN